jgi:hypothetical protein
MNANSMGFGWMHGYEDYLRMFSLNEDDLTKHTLVYPAGIQDFTLTCRKQGWPSVAADSIYAYDHAEMHAHIQARIEKCTTKIANINNPQAEATLLKHWQHIAAGFTQDFQNKNTAEYYIPSDNSLAAFQDQQFELALCPRCPLQRLDNNLSIPLELVQQLQRVAKETRIFIQLTDESRVASILGPILLQLQQADLGIAIEEVAVNAYEGQAAMLKVWPRSCQVPQ